MLCAVSTCGADRRGAGEGWSLGRLPGVILDPNAALSGHGPFAAGLRRLDLTRGEMKTRRV